VSLTGENESGRIAVIGLGNLLLQDDGFGPRALHVLQQRYQFPEHVTLMDVGSPGLDLTDYLTGYQRVIIVDTVLSKGHPGEIRRYGKEAILRHPIPVRLSPHEVGLKDALWISELVGGAPEEVELIGVIPESCDMGVGLTPMVEEAVDHVCDAVLAQLACWGAVAKQAQSAAA
jgi:hydrogenase maturation protease